LAQQGGSNAEIWTAMSRLVPECEPDIDSAHRESRKPSVSQRIRLTPPSEDLAGTIEPTVPDLTSPPSRS
jgi:hypothetical protein